MKRLLSVLALLAPALPVLTETTKVGIKVDSAGAEQVSAGTGTGLLTLGGVLCKAAPAAATAGTTEEVLATCTIPANTLSAAGAAIRVSLFAHAAANANNKRLRIRVGGIGGVIVLDSGAVAFNNHNIYSRGLVVARTGAATATAAGIVEYCTESDAGGGTVAAHMSRRALAITWANANDLVITGLTATAAGDLTLDSYSVEVVQ